MSTVQFVVAGDPIPQPRHRVGRPGGAFVRAYIDDAHPVHGFKDRVRLAARLAMRTRPPIDGPVAVAILFVLARPKSYKASAAYEWRSKKPDADNLAKSVLDALKGVVYTDDSIIVSARFLKVTAPTGASAAAYVVVQSCGDAHATAVEFLRGFTS